MDVKREFEGMAFGLADGVICFLGILIGVAAATNSSAMVIVAGIVGGVADAFGNSIGFYISQAMERGIQTYEKREKKSNTHVHSKSEVIMNAVLSFAGTIFVLVVLILPFLLLSLDSAIKVAFVLGMGMLFVLGVYVSGLMQEKPIKTGAEFAVLGAIGAVLSYFVGAQLKAFLLGGF